MHGHNNIKLNIQDTESTVILRQMVGWVEYMFMKSGEVVRGGDIFSISII